MKTIYVIAFIGLSIGTLVAVDLMAQEPPATRRIPRPGPPVTGDADPRTKIQAELAPLRQSAQVFTDAFNRGDAKAVAALWTKDGEYIDETGNRFAGRDAIEKEYARFFAAQPKAKISVVVDSLRQVNENTAIEDGRAMVELGPASAGGYSQYTATHTKVDGKWRMSSVRDARVGSPSAAHELSDLEWLVGTWSAEENGGKMEATCRWIADKHYLERTYSVSRGDKVVSSGVQVIGWNPQAQRIQSWVFTSDGGHAVGLWSPGKNGWVIETRGTLADGTPTQAVNVLTRIDDRAFSWQSVDRSAGGVSLVDTEEVLLKRVAAKR
jgi:uncharacterized protein (TIGR02246 family)